MEWINEDEKQKYWGNFLNEKHKPVGVTIKRCEKLKPLIWNDQNDFWYYVQRRPEDIGLIILQHMVLNKIIKS